MTSFVPISDHRHCPVGISRVNMLIAPFSQAEKHEKRCGNVFCIPDGEKRAFCFRLEFLVLIKIYFANMQFHAINASRD